MPKKKVSRKNQDATTAIPAVAQLDLKAVRIIEAHSKLVISEHALPGHLDTEIGSDYVTSGEGDILGNVRVKVSSGDTKEKENIAAKSISTLEILVHCQCVFTAGKGPISEEEGQMILASSLQISWPYIRAHVNQISTGMGISPILLPLMKMRPSSTGALTASIDEARP